MNKKRFEIIDAKEVFKRSIFRIEEARLRFERYDGNMSAETVRLNLDRGDSVAALVHDTENDAVVLTEQFRYPTSKKGPGWVMEIPAGILDANESPERAIRREIMEEVGYPVSSIEPICTFYVSPGGTSERILLFYARVSSSQRISSGGGLESEGEDIRTVSLPVADAVRRVRAGDIVDAKTVIALQWLELNGDKVDRS
jgi:ADP-ribose pyrophosphatase